jgi:hypothetical protein
VATIVLIRPNREASRDASNAENDKAAPERIQREESRQLHHDIVRSVESGEADERRPKRLLLANGGRLGGGRQPRKQDGQDHAERSVQHHYRSVTVHRRHDRFLQHARGGASGQRAERGRQRSRERVPGEYVGSGPIGRDVRQRGLLDRQKRPDLLTARTDDAYGPRKHEEPETPCGCEDQPRSGHKHRADHQHAAPSDPIGARREDKRDDGIANERQGQQHAGLRLAQSDANQVEHQYDGQRPVREQPDESRGEEQPRITSETLQCDRYGHLRSALRSVPAHPFMFRQR